MRGKPTAAAAQMIARRLAPSLEPLDTTDLAAVIDSRDVSMGSCARKIPKRTITQRLVSSCHARSRAILHRVRPGHRSSRAEQKKGKKVKQNEITWCDNMAVAGLGPRAVLAACCWVAVACLVSLAHAYCMLMIGTGRSGRAAEQEARAGAARNKQERLVRQGLAFARLRVLALFRALPELAQRPRQPASTVCLGHT